MHPRCSMRTDLYTKAVFTIIAIMLTVIVPVQLVSPRVGSATVYHKDRLTKLGQPLAIENKIHLA
jgi:hypothetical protein